MKKIYNSPTIETAELHLHTAIMSNIGGDTMGGGGGTMFPGGGGGSGAPKRKPF